MMEKESAANKLEILLSQKVTMTKITTFKCLDCIAKFDAYVRSQNYGHFLKEGWKQKLQRKIRFMKMYQKYGSLM